MADASLGRDASLRRDANCWRWLTEEDEARLSVRRTSVFYFSPIWVVAGGGAILPRSFLWGGQLGVFFSDF